MNYQNTFHNLMITQSLRVFSDPLGPGKRGFVGWSDEYLARGMYYANQAMYWLGKGSIFVMPKKNKRSMYEFVTVRLDKKQKTDFTKWAEQNANDMVVYWTSLLDEGYKFSLKANLDSGQYYTTLIATEDCAFNVGKMMSSVHNNPIDSMMLAIWKHIVLFDGQQWVDEDTDSDWG